MWIINASPHPALGWVILGIYRWRWYAALRAAFYRFANGDLWPTTMVVEMGSL